MNYAIIPARMNSKSIPNKNLCKLGNRSLTERAVELAKTWHFDQIIVSTDIPFLKQDLKGVTIHSRSEKLASDKALMKDVVLDVIENCKLLDEGWVTLLQPTSPFREVYDFDRIYDLRIRNKARSVISFKQVSSDHPSRMYTIKHNIAFPMKHNSFDNKQDLHNIYLRNGAYYVFNVGDFRDNPTFYQEDCVPFIMTEERSVNIDSPLDLLLAQAMTWKK